MELILFGEVDFWLYIHPVGEEYFLHYDFWANVPHIQHVRSAASSIDVVIKKTIETSAMNEDCNDENEYSYFGMQRFYEMERGSKC